MTWRLKQTAFRMPTHPAGAISDPIYLGLGNDAGYYLYYFKSKYNIATTFGYSYVVDGATASPLVPYTQAGFYSGYMGFSSASWKLYNTAGFGWVVLSSSYPLGREPVEYTVSGTYYGDNFYTVPSAISTLGETGTLTLTPRGALHGGATKTLAVLFDRWDSSTKLAAYTARGSATGTKYFGLPQWTDGSTTYTRSLAQVSGHFTYGDIYYDSSNSKWVIGTYGSSEGWWDSDDEPSKTSSVTFTAHSPASGDLTITLSTYVLGDNKYDIYTGDAPRFL